MRAIMNIIVMVTMPVSRKGRVLPRINSTRRIGVTITCSMVPISFSLTMAMEASTRPMRMSMTAIRPGT